MSKLNRFDDVELYDALDVADILDIRASEVRERLKSDPRSLPVPLAFESGLIRWPCTQVEAWVRAGCPRDYLHCATEFVPSSVARFHCPHALLQCDPTSPVSDPRIAAAILDGENAVQYPE